MFTIADKDGNIEIAGTKADAEGIGRDNAECEFLGNLDLAEFECCIIDWKKRVSTIYVYEMERTEKISVTVY